MYYTVYVTSVTTYDKIFKKIKKKLINSKVIEKLLICFKPLRKTLTWKENNFFSITMRSGTILAKLNSMFEKRKKGKSNYKKKIKFIMNEI